MTKITKSPGNVFADLGLPDAEGHLAKADLVHRIGELIEEQGLTQAQAAERMGMSQPDVSKMLRGLFRPISMEKLFECLKALGQDVVISIKPSGKEPKLWTKPRDKLPKPIKTGGRQCAIGDPGLSRTLAASALSKKHAARVLRKGAKGAIGITAKRKSAAGK
jgi:predicted XRE-type DNA-binding protein